MQSSVFVSYSTLMIAAHDTQAHFDDVCYRLLTKTAIFITFKELLQNFVFFVGNENFGLGLSTYSVSYLYRNLRRVGSFHLNPYITFCPQNVFVAVVCWDQDISMQRKRFTSSFTIIHYLHWPVHSKHPHRFLFSFFCTKNLIGSNYLAYNVHTH